MTQKNNKLLHTDIDSDNTDIEYTDTESYWYW